VARNVGFVVEYMCDVMARTVQKATSYSPTLDSEMSSSSVGGERVGLGKCNVSCLGLDTRQQCQPMTRLFLGASSVSR
jgi:hypothetical protein